MIVTVLNLANDYLYIWDVQRITSGRRAYPIWIYIVIWVVNIYGRSFWIYECYLGESLYNKDCLTVYHKLLWNLIRIDKNYSKNVLIKAPEKKLMQLKFITGKNNTLKVISSAQAILSFTETLNTAKKMEIK